MAKQIALEGWMSIIPNKMYNGWVAKGYIERGARNISTSTVKGFADVLQMDGKRLLAKSKSESRRLIAQGAKKCHTTYYTSEENYTKINEEVRAWYDEVFEYVEKWLISKNLITLEKGSFKGGFCAVPKEDETTKNWGAPLAKPENKVIQIKEKFGEIVVYFGGLTKQENAKVKRFANIVEKKFDCITRFA